MSMIYDHFQNIKSPLRTAKKWFNLAQKRDVAHPNSVVISTTKKNGQSNSRVVLIKEINNTGFVFYTNYESSKGQELKSNSKICLNFFWDDLYLQLIVRGKAIKTSRKKSQSYWNKRERASQISQSVSIQSQTVKNRKVLDQLYQAFELKMQSKKIPCPKHWGGFLVIPQEIEFWEGQNHRFHNRVKFVRKGNNWLGQRLYP